MSPAYYGRLAAYEAQQLGAPEELADLFGQAIEVVAQEVSAKEAERFIERCRRLVGQARDVA